ncbi:unnamed protein product [Pedinophyceae sp. YPF-701]|nr:unnamed protein product [Pedinophyceae sp. YPF-701]
MTHKYRGYRDFALPESFAFWGRPHYGALLTPPTTETHTSFSPRRGETHGWTSRSSGSPEPHMRVRGTANLETTGMVGSPVHRGARSAAASPMLGSTTGASTINSRPSTGLGATARSTAASPTWKECAAIDGGVRNLCSAWTPSRPTSPVRAHGKHAGSDAWSTQYMRMTDNIPRARTQRLPKLHL